VNAKIAVTQMNCKLGDVQENLRRMSRLAKRAGKMEVDLIVFPELVTTGYSLNEKWVDLAEEIPGPTTERLGKIAVEFGFSLIAGMAERDSVSNRVFNSAVILSPQGDVIGAYRKIHLWATERTYFTPGQEFRVFQTNIGPIGVGICYDLEFPETARVMAIQGAQTLIFPAADMHPFSKQIETFLRSRAAENGVFVAFSNRYGREGDTFFFGRSQIVSPTCKVLAKTEPSKEMVSVKLDFDILSKERQSLPYLEQRMPSTYGLLQSERNPTKP
jgi:predicted amidohydrolase